MKKLLAITLSVLMLAGTLATTVGAYNNDTCMYFTPDNTFTLGDANGDGAFNALDSLALKQKIAGFDVEINAEAADFDTDGKATAKDNLYMKSCFCGNSNVSDYESESTIACLKIGGNPISDYDIIVPAGTDFDRNNIGYAAQTLQTTIAKTSGYEPEICFDTGSKPHHIIFHYIDPLGDYAKENDFGIEHYEYDVTGGDLNIYGSLRGNMYAAFEICENYLGIRYMWYRQTSAYKMRHSEIPEGLKVSNTPLLEFRYCGQKGYSGGESYSINYIPNKMNGTQCYCGNSPKIGYLTGPEYANAHSYGSYWAMAVGDMPGEDFVGDKLYEKQQDGYRKNPKIAYNKWQPCASSEDAYQTLFQGFLLCHEMAESWSNPVSEAYKYGIETASFSINDNSEFCTCKVCNAMANGGFGAFNSKSQAQEYLAKYEGHAEYTEQKKGGRTLYGVTFEKESYSGLYLNITNRCARDCQEYFPGMRVMTIIYDHTIPASIRPESNIVMMFCGHGCNNHIFGSGDCGNNYTCLGTHNTEDETAAKEWADLCHEAGAKIWFWSYDVNYAYYLVDTPCLFNIYYDFNYLINTCHFDGYYYEGQGYSYVSTEKVKAYLAQKLSWDPTISYDEFTELLKEILYLYYGDGYEYIYQFLLMMNEAGDEMPCFINNHDRPGDMYSYSYIAKHYEEMRALLDQALPLADSTLRRENIYGLYMTIDFLGLSSAYDQMYTYGTTESRQLYKDRYDKFYNYLVEYDIDIFDPDYNIYFLPDTINYDINPMTQFYEYGSNIPGLKP